MIKRKILLLFLLLVFVDFVHAQQDPLLTHFIFNKMGYNPGSTGLDDGFSATVIYRNQWDRVVGAPNSAILNLEGNVNRFIPGGVGLNLFHDIIGFNKQNNLMLNYSYPLSIGQDVLGVGIGLGMVNFNVDPDWVTKDPNDKSLNTSAFSVTGLDVNFGLYFKSVKGFYIGLSATHLNSADLSKSVKNGAIETTEKYRLQRHVYLMGGYKTKTIGIGNIDVQMLLKNDLLKHVSVDLNARYLIPSLGYAGITYRNSDAVSIMLGFTPIKNLNVGYSYDLTLSKLSNYSKGSHEILVKYTYFLPLPPLAISRNPRWL